MPCSCIGLSPARQIELDVPRARLAQGKLDGTRSSSGVHDQGPRNWKREVIKRFLATKKK